MSASESTNSHLAHHFDDVEQQFEAARIGMWLFLVTEVLFFGGMVAGYLVYRVYFGSAFAEGSRHLDLWLGTFNTAILLCSSLTMALAVHAAQLGHSQRIVRFLVFTILLACVFLGVKAIEYRHKFHDNLVPGPHFHLEHVYDETVSPEHVQLFFSFYFAMTGMHALHMVIGVGVMAVLAWAAARGSFSPQYYTPVEMTGLYWHFVDIVWVFLFPMLYLIY